MSLGKPQKDLYNLLISILDSDTLKRFPFYSKFKKKWDVMLFNNLLTPQIRFTEVKDDSQQYTLNSSFFSILEFDFHFNIDYVYLHYNLEKTKDSNYCFHKMLVNVDTNKNVNLNGKLCFYNYYSQKERKSYYDNPIFLCSDPLSHESFHVIDGNHCLSYLIDKGENNIPVVLINPYYIPHFLVTSAEAVTYAFLLDIFFLSQADAMDSYEVTKQRLNIFMENFTLDKLKTMKFLH